MLQTIRNIPKIGIIRLVDSHYQDFQSFADQRPPCYANGWLYHLRSARNADGSLGYRYQTDDFLTTLGSRKSFSTCVSPMGQGRLFQTPRLCESIANETGLPVVVKKVDDELYSHLVRQQGFVPCDDGRFLEDEAYPENRIDLNRLFDEQGKLNRRAKQLGRRVRQFEALQVKLTGVDASTNCQAKMTESLSKLLRNEPAKHKAYSQIWRFVQSKPNWPTCFFLTAFFDSQENIHGMYVAERLGDRTAGLYCAVTSRVYPYATEWMDVVFFRTIWKAGFEQLMLGGSETEGVHHYVQKLLPTQLANPMRPLVYRPSSIRF